MGFTRARYFYPKTVFHSRGVLWPFGLGLQYYGVRTRLYRTVRAVRSRHPEVMVSQPVGTSCILGVVYFKRCPASQQVFDFMRSE